MKHCHDCQVLWPFGFALALAALVSFPTWATLELMAFAPAARWAGTALVFCTTATGLILYVRWCIRRNCALRRMLAQHGARQPPQQRGDLASAPR